MPLRRQLLRCSLWALCSLGLALLAGCGFALRQPPSFNFQHLHLDGPSSSVMFQSVVRNLQGIDGLKVTTDSREREQAQVVLILGNEVPFKEITGRTATGAVREFNLRLSVSFRVVDRRGVELLPNTTLTQRRDISFSESAALSKETEEQMLYAEMRDDVLQQLLRRSANVKLR